MNLIYFDNAATSWPKPEDTLQAMNRFINSIGGNPGRSGHRLSIQSARIIYNARELVAGIFGIENPLRMRIIFTKNSTGAINIAIFGLLKPWDHVIRYKNLLFIKKNIDNCFSPIKLLSGYCRKFYGKVDFGRSLYLLRLV